MPAYGTQTFEDYRSREPEAGWSVRSFGLTLAAVLALLGLAPALHQRPLRPWYLAASAVFLALALLWPGLLAPFNRVWIAATRTLGKVTNPIVTTLLFFTVFTPVAVLLRVLGKDPLRLRIDAAAATYWIARTPPGPAPATMTDEF